MSTMLPEEFIPFPAEVQIGFYHFLEKARHTFLQQGLGKTLERVGLSELDYQLNRLVPPEALKKLAKVGLRGEIVFPTPLLIVTNPHILGYYRLLYGISQKVFYGSQPWSKIKSLEENGTLSKSQEPLVTPACEALIQTGCQLLAAIEQPRLSLFNDLQLLTLGAQLRGARNNSLGKRATNDLLQFLNARLQRYIVSSSPGKLVIENALRRLVEIRIGSDPDIEFIETMSNGDKRLLLSIEIKGGIDRSNLHNRIGEAEKSHQNAKERGHFEFVTIINLDVPFDQLKKESPTTSHFFCLDRLLDSSTKQYIDFSHLLETKLSIDLQDS